MKGGQSNSGCKFSLASEINCVLSSENMNTIHTSGATSIDVIIEEDGVIFFQLQFHFLIRLFRIFVHQQYANDSNFGTPY